MFPPTPQSSMQLMSLMRDIPWVTIETLTPGGMSAVSVGAEPRDFAGWQRVIQRLLGKTPAVYDGLTTNRVVAAVAATRDTGAGVDIPVETSAGAYMLRVRPVLGPAGEVHAVRLGLAAAQRYAPGPGAAVGGIWNLESQTLCLPAELARFSGMSAREYAPIVSIAEMFQRWTGFERHAELLDLLYEPDPDAAMQFDVTVGARGRWRVSIRARDDERTRGAWWLIEDLGEGHVPPQSTALERVALREAHRRAGNHLGVLQAEHASISHWLTDPAPWVRWHGLSSPVEVFHPDDRPSLAGANERLLRGVPITVTVRTLDDRGDYTPTTLSLYPYPGYSGRLLAIAEFARAPQERPMAGYARVLRNTSHRGEYSILDRIG